MIPTPEERVAILERFRDKVDERLAGTKEEREYAMKFLESLLPENYVASMNDKPLSKEESEEEDR